MSTLHSPGDIIAEQYRVITALGEFKNSNTYVVEDLTKNKLVAIKAISLKKMNSWKDFELMERQAKVLANLNHPAIPKYIKYFHVDIDSDRLFYLVQQLTEGNSLANLVARGWRAGEAEIRNIALQVLEILIFLHQQNPPIIHRDIQPQNLIRNADNQIFLVDFGSVKATSPSLQIASNTFVGSYGYISPEQLYGKARFASDLYSLGASLLFVLTGKAPDEFAQQQRKIDFRGHVQLSPHFANWLEKMLEPSLKARFHTASEAISGLKQQKSPSSRRKTKAAPKVAPKSVMKPPTLAQEGKDSAEKTSRKKRPTGSRVILIRTDERLVVELPLISLDERKGGLFDFLGEWHRLEINSQRFVIAKGRLGFNTSHEGWTKDIIKAELKVGLDLPGKTNYTLLIWEDVKAHTFAPALTDVEKEWLVEEISDFLEYARILQGLDNLI